MPLKLVAPRAHRTKNWSIRGTYLGVRLDETTGTPNRDLARKILNRRKEDIERGELSARPELTFASAMMAYLNAGGAERFLKPIADHFGPRALAREIDQIRIDAAAVALYPHATPATRNRQVYSPISAILRHAGIRMELRRPKGAEGETRTAWLNQEQAARAVKAATGINTEFGALLVTLLYTGLRLSEALGLEWERVDLSAGIAFVPRTKTGAPRAVHLPPQVVAALAGVERKRFVFRWSKGGALYALLRETEKVAGMKLGFHLFRHTYATWMRLYAGLSVEDLAQTGAWSSAKSAKRYAHIDALTIASRANMLPDASGATRAKPVDRKKKGV